MGWVDDWALVLLHTCYTWAAPLSRTPKHVVPGCSSEHAAQPAPPSAAESCVVPAVTGPGLCAVQCQLGCSLLGMTAAACNPTHVCLQQWSHGFHAHQCFPAWQPPNRRQVLFLKFEPYHACQAICAKLLLLGSLQINRHSAAPHAVQVAVTPNIRQ